MFIEDNANSVLTLVDANAGDVIVMENDNYEKEYFLVGEITPSKHKVLISLETGEAILELEKFMDTPITIYDWKKCKLVIN